MWILTTNHHIKKLGKVCLFLISDMASVYIFCKELACASYYCITLLIFIHSSHCYWDIFGLFQNQPGQKARSEQQQLGTFAGISRALPESGRTWSQQQRPHIHPRVARHPADQPHSPGRQKQPHHGRWVSEGPERPGQNAQVLELVGQQVLDLPAAAASVDRFVYVGLALLSCRLEGFELGFLEEMICVEPFSLQ